jgi:probable blue pigment (indigoidine) exporter
MIPTQHTADVTAGPSAWRLALLTALGPTSWGTTYLVTTELLPPDRPFLSGAIRALPAGLIVLAATRTLPRGAWWWRAAVLGALNIGIFFGFLFIAAYRLPGGVAATLGAAQPLLVAGLALVLLGERPTLWRFGWGLAGLLGVAMMVLRGSAAFDPIGIAAGLVGTAAMAGGVVLTKKWGRPVGLMTFTGWQLSAGGLLLLPLALFTEGTLPVFDAKGLAGYLWLSVVGTLVAYALWFRGLQRLPVAAASFLPLLSPAVATVLGWLVLGQSLTLVQALGFGLALVAIAAAQLDPDALSTLLRKGRL